LEYERVHSWRRWASNAEDLLAALRLVEARVAEQSEETKIALRAEFPESGRSVTRNSLQEFERDIKSDFYRVGAVDCAFFGLESAEDTGLDNGTEERRKIRVTVDFSLSEEDLLFEYPASMSVRGTDLIVVDGIFDQIREKLEDANKATVRLPPPHPMTTFACLPLLIIITLGILLTADPNPSDSVLELSSGGVIALVGAWIMVPLGLSVYLWISTPVEFLEGDNATRWRRSKKLVYGAVGALIISLIASLIFTLP
jgi:hypothetical protein